MSDINLKIGHLGKADAAKLPDIPIVQGQVIFSENHAVQFVDYEGKRHTYGDIISGAYNGNTYIDFNGDATWNDMLNAIIADGSIKDGQRVSAVNTIMKYRKIGEHNFLTLEDIIPGSVPYIINYGGTFGIEHQTTVMLMDIINRQLYLLTIDVASDNSLTITCEDLDNDTVNISTLVNVSITDFLLQISPVNSHIFEIVSISDNVIPSISGFYSIVDDLD